jgi:CRP-like cAMP-binding protein
MSRFYQRYLGTANPQHKAGSQKQDVTSMSTTKRQEAAPGRDNNKAPTVPSKGRRVEVFNNPDEFRPAEEEIPVVQKDEAAKRFLFSSLFEHYLFESVDPEDLERLVDRMNPFAVSAGQNIINQGDEGDLFYCLDTGTATANVAGVGEVMKYDKAGSCFGELALIYNCPRAATVTAVTDCTMWTLDLKTFRQVLATSSSNSMVKRCEFLKKCKFLEPLTNEMIGKLAGALEVVEFKTGDYIIRQGDHGDRFFIIEDGTVRCTQIKATGREVELM